MNWYQSLDTLLTRPLSIIFMWFIVCSLISFTEKYWKEQSIERKAPATGKWRNAIQATDRKGRISCIVHYVNSNNAKSVSICRGSYLSCIHITKKFLFIRKHKHAILRITVGHFQLQGGLIVMDSGHAHDDDTYNPSFISLLHPYLFSQTLFNFDQNQNFYVNPTMHAILEYPMNISPDWQGWTCNNNISPCPLHPNRHHQQYLLYYINHIK